VMHHFLGKWNLERMVVHIFLGVLPRAWLFCAAVWPYHLVNQASRSVLYITGISLGKESKGKLHIWSA
jgi:hypothetical protein